MKKNQWIAVVVSLALLAYLLFSGPIMNLFNLSNKSSNAKVEQTGLAVEELAVGTGPLVEPGDTLTVHYVGTLSDGRVFDSSVDRNTPFTFELGVGSVIRGWDEGLVGMRVGGKRRLVIPPEYGYGEQDLGVIPSNSTLEFIVELLDATKP
jgi:peptidylprolyl isomerase